MLKRVSSPEPEQVGEYRLLECLGQGGMATVYRAERLAEAGFKKQVAVKRMLPQYRRIPALLERFAAEARTSARLDHPNVVQVLEFGVRPEPFLVMELVEGVALAELMMRLSSEGGKLAIQAACFIGAEAAQGLDYAHRKRDESGTPLGIVHRDVSPQNILLSGQGAVKVADFGLVKVADSAVQTGSGVPIGKINYVAPEQSEHRALDARADVFSLGIVLWEMLTLKPLLSPDSPAQAAAQLKRCAFVAPSAHRSDVPQALDAAVMGCLARDVEARTPSAKALSMQLSAILHETWPGYGREALARLLARTFPERGWHPEGPNEPAAQPDAHQRAVLPPISAARAMQEVKDAAPAREAASPRRRPRFSRRFIFVAFSLILSLLTAVLVALGLALWDRPPDRPRLTLPPVSPTGGIMVEANVQGARIFLDGQELGQAPVQLPPSTPSGASVCAVAPGHQPAILRPNELAELVNRGQGTATLELFPSRRPDRVVHVTHTQPAVAYALSGRELGAVPGLLLVPRPARRIRVVPAAGPGTLLSVAQCDIGKVCVVEPHRD